MKRVRKDIGETLVEVLLTIVIISLTITALMSGMGTVATAATAQRTSVTVDLTMRNYAEAIKGAVQNCVANGTFVMPAQPSGFAVAVAPSDTLCPPVATAKVLKLTVSRSSVPLATMQIEVRTP